MITNPIFLRHLDLPPTPRWSERVTRGDLVVVGALAFAAIVSAGVFATSKRHEANAAGQAACAAQIEAAQARNPMVVKMAVTYADKCRTLRELRVLTGENP